MLRDAQRAGDSIFPPQIKIVNPYLWAAFTAAGKSRSTFSGHLPPKVSFAYSSGYVKKGAV
jgi:hypothetical protein